MSSAMPPPPRSATRLLRDDHCAITALFHQYHPATPDTAKQAIVSRVCRALEVHAQLEEEIFYPAMQALSAERAVFDKSLPEHREMRRMIGVLRTMSPGEPGFDRTFMALMRDVMHHVADEETLLLPEAERLLGPQLEAMGVELTRRRVELLAPRAGIPLAMRHGAVPPPAVLLLAGAVLAGGYVVNRALSARH